MLCNARFKKMDDIAQRLVPVAIKHESAITQVRDTYVAHVQEKGRFKRTPEAVFAEHGTPSDHADWILLMRGIRAYGLFVVNNFGAELKVAREKYRAMPRPETKRSEPAPDPEFYKVLR